MTEVAPEGVVLGDTEALRKEAEAALSLVAQALPGLTLTTFQMRFVLQVLNYEVGRLEEGWVDDYIVDLAAEVAGSP